jgi:mycothiol system anti-sigma-R factor
MTTHERSSGPSSVDCIATIESLYHFLDGELAEDLRVKIELHLSECPPCVEIVRFESQLRLVIQRRSQEVLPQALRQRVAAALDEERNSEPPG